VNRPRMSNGAWIFASVIAAAILAPVGAYATSYVVSRNSQIGPRTVSGALPPSGKHDNIIKNSIGGKDINESKLGTVPNAAHFGERPRSYFAHVIPVSSVRRADNTFHTLVLVDGLRLQGYCGATSVQLKFDSSSGGTLDGLLVYMNAAYNNAVPLPANYSDSVTFDDASSSTYPQDFQEIYRRSSDGAIVNIAGHIGLNQGSTSCTILAWLTTTG
jgi:hypothetical protein